MTAMAAYDLSGLRVLLAEHNDFMRRVLVSVLRTLKMPQVFTAASEYDAWQQFCGAEIDLVLCDWSPGLDGLSFLDSVRRRWDSPNPFATVIMVSAFADEGDVTAARDRGTNGFIVKPVSPRGIYQRIAQAIEHERPFVRTRSFFGPDRRARQTPLPAERDRRAGDRRPA